MLLIVANEHDVSADALRTTWGPADVRIMRPSDLSVGGWSYRPGDIGSARFVAGGASIRVSDLAGVLTRMACVFESDLGHIQASDRGYVASEMTATLFAWLFELQVPVINRPTPTALCGPLWPQEKWLRVATSLGMRVATARRHVVLHDSSSATDAPTSLSAAARTATRCTVVDAVCIGAPTSQCAQSAVKLAKHAGCRLLSVYFQADRLGHSVVAADVWPDVTSPAVASALRSALDGHFDHVPTEE